MKTATRKKNETLEEKRARLTQIARESKASGIIRCTSWDDFFQKVGLR